MWPSEVLPCSGADSKCFKVPRRSDIKRCEAYHRCNCFQHVHPQAPEKQNCKFGQETGYPTSILCVEPCFHGVNNMTAQEEHLRVLRCRPALAFSLPCFKPSPDATIANSLQVTIAERLEASATRARLCEQQLESKAVSLSNKQVCVLAG